MVLARNTFHRLSDSALQLWTTCIFAQSAGIPEGKTPFNPQTPSCVLLLRSESGQDVCWEPPGQAGFIQAINNLIEFPAFCVSLLRLPAASYLNQTTATQGKLSLSLPALHSPSHRFTFICHAITANEMYLYDAIGFHLNFVLYQ